MGGFTVDWRPKWHAQVDKSFNWRKDLVIKSLPMIAKMDINFHMFCLGRIFFSNFLIPMVLLEKMANDQDDQELHTVMNFVNELFKIDNDAVAPIKKFKDNKKLKTRKNKKNGKKTSKV